MLTLLLVPAVGPAVGGWLLPVVHSSWGRMRRPGSDPQVLVEDTVLLFCAVVLGAVLLWLTASVAVCLGDALRPRLGVRRVRAGAEVLPTAIPSGFFRPRLLQALVGVALGSFVPLAAPGVAAAPEGRTSLGGPERPSFGGPALPELAGGPELPELLDGLPLPDRPYGGVRHHPVTAGESLWSITATELGPGARTEAVARSWPRLHRLNRLRIGPDPHLIHPGTVLRLPAWGTATSRGATR